MLELNGVSDSLENDGRAQLVDLAGIRRAGLLHGTRVATNKGWKVIESVVPGDLVRTIDHGFREVQRVSDDDVSMPRGSVSDEFKPIHFPERAAYNTRPIWVLPEQGFAIDQWKIGFDGDALAVIPARMLNGVFGISARVPSLDFQVSSLFFEFDEIIYIEGGLQAFCPSCQVTQRRKASSNTANYFVPEERQALALVERVAVEGEASIIANPLGSLPAPIPQDPILPVRPAGISRRPGRPGRPSIPALFLRSDWQT